jgi:hypothetical protein
MMYFTAYVKVKLTAHTLSYSFTNPGLADIILSLLLFLLPSHRAFWHKVTKVLVRRILLRNTVSKSRQLENKFSWRLNLTSHTHHHCRVIFKYIGSEGTTTVKSTVKPGYNNIGLCDTSSVTSHVLWYQLIPHC